MDSNLELSNREIIDLLTGKEYEEDITEEKKSKVKQSITFLEACKAWIIVKDYIEQNEDYSEVDFNLVNQLNNQFESYREKHMVKSKIFEYFKK